LGSRSVDDDLSLDGVFAVFPGQQWHHAQERFSAQSEKLVAFGPNGKTETEDDRILTQFKKTTDPEEQSHFYKRHLNEIHRGFEARKNNP
jgi:hypothetical protein